MKKLFVDNKIINYTLEDWNFTKQLKLSLNIDKRKKTLIVKGIDSSSDRYQIAKQMLEHTKKDHRVIMIKPLRKILNVT